MNGRYSLNLPVDLKQEAEQIAEKQGVSLNQFILWSLAEKVTALKSKIDDPNYPNITYQLGAESRLIPTLKNKGIRVQTIVIAYLDWKESIMEIAHQYDLPEKIIKEALSFYDSHKKAVDLLIEDNDQAETARD